MPFTPKDWKNSPAQDTALSAEALEDLETRVTDYTDSELTTHSADTTSVHGITDTSALATATDVATAVSDHSADTTSVHGIADTSVLATTTTLAGSGMGVIVHGATAGTARGTAFAQYIWIGTVEPTNMADGDLWFSAVA